jgi:hypothetical protein
MTWGVLYYPNRYQGQNAFFFLHGSQATAPVEEAVVWQSNVLTPIRELTENRLYHRCG